MAPKSKFPKKLKEAEGETALEAIQNAKDLTTPQKEVVSKGRKRKEVESAEQTPEAVVKKGRQKKPKPEGPYTQFKEQGSIPEPDVGPGPILAEFEGRPTLRLLAWNVGGLRGILKGRSAEVQEAVTEGQPDVLAITEHKLQENDTETTTDALLELLPEYEVGHVHCSTAKKGYSGTLVLLKKGSQKPLEVHGEDLPSAKDEGRIVIVEFQELYLVFVYVMNSGATLERLSERTEKWDLQLRHRLAELRKEKAVVLMGDLNVAHRDEDIWNVEAPHTVKSAGTTPEERKSFENLLNDGFVDGFLQSHQDALGAFTYWSIRAGNRVKNRGLRLDYVLASKDMIRQNQEQTGPLLLETFHLSKTCTGDHCPVGAVVVL